MATEKFPGRFESLAGIRKFVSAVAAEAGFNDKEIYAVELAVDEVRDELGRVVAKKHLASSKLMEENKKHEDLSEKIELAVNENREGLVQVFFQA